MKDNSSVIMWLVIFPPVGVVKVWTASTWKLPTKIALTLMIIAYFGAIIVSVAYPLHQVEKALELTSI